MKLPSFLHPSPLALSALLLALPVAAASAVTFNGNGGTGFGGSIGNGILTVTTTATDINFSLAPGVSFTGNVLALYVDSIAGGANSTSAFTDNGANDAGRTALSGFNGGNSTRTVATFPVGFGADFGITLDPANNFSGTYNLSTPTNFGFIQGNGLSGTGSGPFTFSLPFTAIGLPANGGSFQFLGSLISSSAYRSNETFGTSVTQNTDSNGNAGFNGTQTFTTANAVPEPGTVAFFSVGAALLAGLGWRRRTIRRA